MRQIVLCEGPVKVQIEADGKRAILSLTNEVNVDFAIPRGNLEAVLAGETVQVSHAGVFCRLTRDEDQIRVVFAWKSHHEHATCTAEAFEGLVNNLQ